MNPGPLSILSDDTMSLQRQGKILEFALSGLMRRKGRNLSILAVYSFTVASLASILFLTQALKAEAERVLEAAPALIVQKMSAGRHDLVPLAYGEAIRQLPGVGKVTPRFWGYYYDALTGANYTLLGVEESAGNLVMDSGRLPAGAGECAIGAGVSRVRSVGIGDELILIDAGNVGKVLEIVGLFSSDSSLLTHDLILLPRAELLSFFNFPEGRATDLSVEVRNPREVPTLATKVRRLFPDARPITRAEILRTYEAVFNWRSGMMLTFCAAALVAFAILAWDKATGLSAEERREIGILKAVGWDTGDVLALKFWEGAAVSLSSFLLGMIAAYLHVFHLGAPLLSPVLKGWSVLFPEFSLPPAVDPYLVFVLGFFTVLPYIAATLVPSWKAAVTDPDSVMRS